MTTVAGKTINTGKGTVAFEPSQTTFDAFFDNGIPVIHAALHQSIQIPGGVAAEKTLSDFKYPGIQMAWTPVGLLAKIKGKKVMIPSANVVNALCV